MWEGKRPEITWKKVIQGIDEGDRIERPSMYYRCCKDQDSHKEYENKIRSTMGKMNEEKRGDIEEEVGSKYLWA